MAESRLSVSRLDSLQRRAIEASKAVLDIEEVRPYQLDAPLGLMDGRDVLVAQPTGSGKSVVYQLLPFAFDILSVLCDQSLREEQHTVAHNGHGTIFFHGILIYFHVTLIYFHGTLIYFHGTLSYSSWHTFVFLTAHFYISTAHFYTSHGTLIYFSRHIFISAHGTEHFLFCCYHSHVVSKVSRLFWG